MGCPDADVLERYHGSGAVPSWIEEHLKGCESCTEQWLLFDQIREHLSVLDLERPLPVERQTIPGYVVLGELHRGGQGIVYRGIHVATRRPVALKVPLGGSEVSPRDRQRFDREIELVARLRHPNIVTLYDSGSTTDGRAYFAMELVRGAPITRSFRDRGPLTIAELLSQFVKVCDAIEYAHAHGTIHRDLKPSNVLVDELGEPRVLDFGLAKPLAPGGDSTDLTRTGEFLGSLAYAAPEQLTLAAASADARVDVYALGLILYELLVGELPYRVDGFFNEVVAAITEAPREAPSARRKRRTRSTEPEPIVHGEPIPRELDAIVLKAIEPDPAARYPSVAALAADVRALLAGEPVRARPSGAWPRIKRLTRRHRATLLVGAVLTTVFGVALWIAVRPRPPHLLDVVDEARTRLLLNDVAGAEEILFRAELWSSDPPGRLGDRELSGPALCHWALWDLYRDHPCVSTIQAHSGAILSLAFDSNESHLCSVGLDGSVKLWDVRSGTLVRAISHVRATLVTYDATGHALLLGDGNGVVHVLSGEGECRREIRTELGSIAQLAVRGDGGQLAAASQEEDAIAVRVFDLRTGAEVASYPRAGLQGTIHILTFDREGRLAVFHSWPGGSEMRCCENGALIAPPASDLTGDELLAGTVGSHIRLYRSGSLTWSRPEIARPTHVAMNADTSLLAHSGGDAFALRVWDVRPQLENPRRNPIERQRLLGHKAAISAITALGGSRFASADDSGVIKVWDLEPMIAHPVRAPDSNELNLRCYSVDVNRDGTLAACALQISDDRAPLTEGLVVDVYDLKSEARIWENADARGNWVKFDARDPQVLIIGTQDGSLRAHDVRGGKDALWVSPVQLHAKVDFVAFSPDGRWLAWGGDDAHVLLWERASGKTLALDTGAAHVSTIIWERSGSLLIGTGVNQAGDYGEIQTWDPARAERKTVIRAHPANIHALSLQPGGDVVASGSGDSTIKWWDWRRGREVAVLSGHDTSVFALAWSPGGEVLVSGDSGGNIRVWDWETHRCLAQLGDPSRGVFSLAFATDHSLVAATEGGFLTRYDLRALDRSIAGNTGYWLDRIPRGEQDPDRAEHLRRWSQRVLAEPPD